MALPVFPNEIQGLHVLSSPATWSWKLPIKRTPRYKTIIQTPANFVGETRVSLTTYPIWEYEMDMAYMYGDMTPGQVGSAFQQIVGFYASVFGAAGEWLYFDPWDNGSNLNVATTGLGLSNLWANSIGMGDGSTANFLTTRNVAGVVDLIQNFAPGYPTVYVGGVSQGASTYSIDQFGTLTFNVAPAAGKSVQWAGQFYFRCRFMEDALTGMESIRNQMWRVSSIKWKTLLR